MPMFNRPPTPDASTTRFPQAARLTRLAHLAWLGLVVSLLAGIESGPAPGNPANHFALPASQSTAQPPAAAAEELPPAGAPMADGAFESGAYPLELRGPSCGPFSGIPYVTMPCQQHAGAPHSCPPAGGACWPGLVGGPCGVSAEQTRIMKSVVCGPGGGGGECHWRDARMFPWEVFGAGEYVGPARTAHVSNYRLRVDDQITLTYLLSRDEVSEYHLEIGDEIRIESPTDEDVNRAVTIMPDGRITLHLLGSVHAAGRTIPELADELTRLYRERRFIRDAAITVTGVNVNTKLLDVQATVDSRAGQGGTGRTVRIAPDGIITLAGIEEPICCQGLTVSELQQEINARYQEVVVGLDVTVTLQQRAPSYVHVIGEVRRPDRFELQGPTRLSHILARAGGPTIGGNQREIVVMRHTENWGMIATKLDLRGFLLAKRPCPADDIWLRDADIVVVPKHPIQRANELIRLIFTEGLYGVVPRWGSTFAGGSLL